MAEDFYPGVAIDGSLVPTLATDCLLLVLLFTMAFEAVLTFDPGVAFDAFLALDPPWTLTATGPDELCLSLRKLAPFSLLAMLLRSTVAVFPDLNPY